MKDRKPRISRSRLAWLVTYGIVTFLAFPHPLGDTVIDLGWGLAWFSPACLLLGLKNLSPGRAARAAFFASWLTHAAMLHWIYVVTVVHGGASSVIGVLAPLALASYIGLYSALFGAAWAWLAQRGVGSPFVAAALWVVIDHLRGFVLTGFPWALIGYAQHESVMLSPVASWTGVYGLSFVTVLGGAALADWVVDRRMGTGASRARVGIVAGILLLHGIGLWTRFSEPVVPLRSVRVAAIQGSIEQPEKWSPGRLDEIFDVYEALSRRAIAQGAQLVVWPETAIPSAIELDSELAARLTSLAAQTHTAFVVGAVGVELNRAAGEIADYYDSAFVFDAEGRFVARYDKSALVPFGEYVPLRGLLGGWIGAIARGIAPVDVTAGPGPRAVSVDLGPGLGFIRIGIPICYELLFPGRVRGFVEDGAQLLVAITNDAWYGRTGAPHQFLAMTSLRSAETGAWTVRAANTGVSAIIDDRGRVRERSALFEPAVLVADVPLVGGTNESVVTQYVRWGDALVAACWLGLLAATGAAMRRGRRASGMGRDPAVHVEEHDHERE